jgi:hypothetical protein
MKILIICLPRTGSTSLTNKIADDNNLNPIFEPFDGQNRVIYNGEDNVVLKTIIDQTYPIGQKDYVNYWFNKSKEFDKIILLSRKDLKACAESLSFLDYNHRNGFQYNEKYEWHSTPNFNQWYKYVISKNEDLHILGKLLNIDIIYYEDIFDLNSTERLRVGNLKLSSLI